LKLLTLRSLLAPFCFLPVRSRYCRSTLISSSKCGDVILPVSLRCGGRPERAVP
jgi:hypothetical protein